MPRKKASKAAPRRAAGDLVPVNDLSVVRDPEFRTYYANNAKVLSAYYEISLVCGEIVFGPDGNPSINEKCRIVMNPAHAKALAIALGRNVQGWEQKFGLIRFPPGMVDDAPTDKA